jgi:hypothetical protein
VRVAELILKRWDALLLADAEENVRAGLELLSRVTARRFYKPVFRNLPNSKNTLLRKKPEQLALTFMDPVIRFKAERKIEERAGLRRGSVVIHCPRRITAQKVANVLLVFPTKDGSAEMPEKLRDIKQLDPDVFGAHQDAILAVEKMYESMWRLVVYVAPDALARYPVVTESAGKVIFDTMDEYQSYPDEKGWDNDKHLAIELERKFGDLVRQHVVTEGPAAMPDVPRPKANKEIEEGMVVVPIGNTDQALPEASAADGSVHSGRQQRWVATVRLAWRTDVTTQVPKLMQFYDSQLSEIPEPTFERLLQRVESEYASVPKNRRPTSLDGFLKVVTEIREKETGLFGER